MLWNDVVRLALEALGRQKARTTLTALGVVAGTIALCSSLALGRGVQEAIVREYARFNELRHVEVYGGFDPDDANGPVPANVADVPGEMSEARRRRLRAVQELRWRWQQPARRARPLSPSVVRELAQLPHVRTVTPDLNLWGGRAYLGSHAVELADVACVPVEEALLAKAIVAGESLASEGDAGVLVSEYALYRLGVVDEAEVERALGRTLRLEFRRGGGASPRLLLSLLNVEAPELTPRQEEILDQVLKALPHAIDGIDLPPDAKDFVTQLLDGAMPVFRHDARVQQEYPIRGVFRMLGEEEAKPRQGRPFGQVDAFLSRREGGNLYFRFADNAAVGLNRVTLEVDDTANVGAVVSAVKARGLNAHSFVEQIELEQFTYSLIFAGMTLVAALAFVVAALGITNTMLMSVLERTREIGIMKAVGASNWHVSATFLLEGLLLGLVGGLLGLALTHIAALPGDAWVRALLAERTRVELSDSLFVFPWWLQLGAPAFACLVTTLAAYPPARRAASVPPVEALRHAG